MTFCRSETKFSYTNSKVKTLTEYQREDLSLALAMVIAENKEHVAMRIGDVKLKTAREQIKTYKIKGRRFSGEERKPN